MLVVSFNGELCLCLVVGMLVVLLYLVSISVFYDSLFNVSGNYIYY